MPTKLGQNFLRDKSIIQKIIQVANLTPADLVVEIGPGEGILTEELSKMVGKVLAIEIDKDLIPALHKRFANNKKIEIINADVLKIDLQKIVSSCELPASPVGGQVTNYKVVANIPYYITSPIIRLFLESEIPPQEMILMVQKEVAERIVASPGKMSILALAVQYYAQAQILFSLPSTAFFPVPKVDSAVIRIVPNPTHALPLERGGVERKKFFRIVRAGFSAKRKTLANNLANSFHLDKEAVENKLNKLGLAPLTRAQELSLEDWKKLAKNLEN